MRSPVLNHDSPLAEQASGEVKGWGAGEEDWQEARGSSDTHNSTEVREVIWILARSKKPHFKLCWCAIFGGGY